MPGGASGGGGSGAAEGKEWAPTPSIGSVRSSVVELDEYQVGRSERGSDSKETEECVGVGVRERICLFALARVTCMALMI